MSFSVPIHPKYCPMCKSVTNGKRFKVKIYHLNQKNDAIFMCSNMECPWPLTTHEPHEILGKSDLISHILRKKEKKKQKRTNTQSLSKSIEKKPLLRDSLFNVDKESDNPIPLENKDCHQSSCNLDLNVFSVPRMLSPLHSSPAYPSIEEVFKTKIPCLLSPLPNTPIISHRREHQSESDSESETRTKKQTIKIENEKKKKNEESFSLGPSKKKKLLFNYNALSPESLLSNHQILNLRKKNNDVTFKNESCNLSKTTSSKNYSGSSVEKSFKSSSNTQKEFFKSDKKLSFKKTSQNSSVVNESSFSLSTTNNYPSIITKINNNDLSNSVSVLKSNSLPSKPISSPPSKPISSPLKLISSPLKLISSLPPKPNLSPPPKPNSSPTPKPISSLPPKPNSSPPLKPISSPPSKPISLHIQSNSSPPSKPISLLPSKPISSPSPPKPILSSPPLKPILSSPPPKPISPSPPPKPISSPSPPKPISSPSPPKSISSSPPSKPTSLQIQPISSSHSKPISILSSPSHHIKLIKIDKLPDNIDKRKLKKVIINNGRAELLPLNQSVLPREKSSYNKNQGKSSNLSLSSIQNSKIRQDSKVIDLSSIPQTLDSLSNRVSMNLGHSVSLSILNNSPSGKMISSAELSNLKSLLTRHRETNQRFVSLLKQVEAPLSLQDIEAIQESLSYSPKEGEAIVIFDVHNYSKTQKQIDLPLQSLDVKSSNGVSLRLNSDSDGINRESLLVSSSLLPQNSNNESLNSFEKTLLLPPPLGLENYMANSESITKFKKIINAMMLNYVLPNSWRVPNVDPILAMLLSTKQESSLNEIELESMIEMHVYIKSCERYLRAKERMTRSPSPPIIKVEVNLEFEENPSSSPHSVCVNPSVEIIPEHTKPPGSAVGKGRQVIHFTFEKSTFGPIRVDSESETRAVIHYVQEKISEIKLRREGKSGSQMTYSYVTEQGKSLLSPEILRYIESALSVKGMKESIIGRKKHNYPKRSQIIKKDSLTAPSVVPSSLGVEPIKIEETIDNDYNKVVGANEEISRDIESMLSTLKSNQNPFSIQASPSKTSIWSILQSSKESPSNSTTNKFTVSTRNNRRKSKCFTPTKHLLEEETSVYVRQKQRKRIIKLLEHKERKEYLLQKYKNKNPVQDLHYYKGFEDQGSRKEKPLDKDVKKIPRMNSNGIRKYVKKTESSPIISPSKPLKKPSEISIEEQDIMRELLQVAEELEDFPTETLSQRSRIIPNKCVREPDEDLPDFEDLLND